MVSTVSYKSECYIPACECGVILVGDKVKLSIDEGYAPDWPEYIVGTVADANGRDYVFEYLTEDLNGGPELKECLITPKAWCCCDILSEEFNCEDFQTLPLTP